MQLWLDLHVFLNMHFLYHLKYDDQYMYSVDVNTWYTMFLSSVCQSFNILIHCYTLIFSTTVVWRCLKDFEHMLSAHSRDRKAVLQGKASLRRQFFSFSCWIAWPHHLCDDIRAAGRPHKFEQGRSQERCGVLFHDYAAYPWEEHTWKGHMCVCVRVCCGGCFAPFVDVQKNIAVYNLLNDPPRHLAGWEDDWRSGH